MNSIVRSTIAAQIGAAIAIAVSSVDVAPVQALAIDGSFGLTNPAQTIDFRSVYYEPGTALTNQYSSAGVTFSNLYFIGSYDFETLSNGLSSYQPPGPINIVGIDGSSVTTVNPFSIQFTTPQTRAAFGIGIDTGSATFTALLNGAVVESFTSNSIVSGAPAQGYYGFTGVTFDQIQVVVNPNPDSWNVRYGGIEELQFGEATPVPFGFTPLPGLAISGLLCGVNRLRKRFAKEDAEA